MDSLRGRDLDALVSVLRAAEAAPGLGAFGAAIVAPLRRLVPCDVVAYNEVDFEHRHVAYVSDPEDAFDKLLEIEYHLAATLWTHSEIAITISFNRAAPDFSERDRMILDLLRPHLAQAYLQADARARARAALSGANGLGDNQAVVRLDRDGRPQLMNARAQAWLTTYFGTVDGGGWPEDIALWLRVNRRRTKCRSEMPALAEPLVRERAEGQLTMHFLPALERDEHDALLLVERARPCISEGVLAELGLSPREAEVLEYARRGMTNPEIGDALALSPRTVQKHLEHIFAKLEVHNRAAAVAKALGASAA